MLSKIFYYLAPRSDIPISNQFDLLSFGVPDMFHIVVYFLETNKAKIIVRRLDSDIGWGVDLKIKIYDRQQSEIYSIGSSYQNFKMVEIKTNINLGKKVFTEQLIPKIIMQNNFSNDYKSIHHYNAVQTFLELNPEYSYEFFDDARCRAFLKEHFDLKVLQCFDILYPGAYRSDLFRLCFMYQKGGCYFDCKHVLRVPLSDIISPQDTNMYCKDAGPLCIHNGIFFTEPKDPNLYNCIQEIVHRSQTGFIHPHSLGLTGPLQFYNHVKHKNISFRLHLNHDSKRELEREVIRFEKKNKNIIFRSYCGYYSKGHRSSNYEALCREKKVYCQDYQRIENGKLTIMRAPESRQRIEYKQIVNRNSRRIRQLPEKIEHRDIIYDRFKFTMRANNQLQIERIDSKSGWNFPLRIFIIDEETNKKKEYNVGTCGTNQKILVL
jgi:mannosyltransferase OCH1-like enzyme